jgi:hypothetical protein
MYLVTGGKLLRSRKETFKVYQMHFRFAMTLNISAEIPVAGWEKPDYH